MHLALATPEWYPGEGGGIATYARTVATQAVRLGHRVTVLAGTATRGRAAAVGGALRVLPIEPGAHAEDTAARFQAVWARVSATDRPDVLEAPEFGGVIAPIATAAHAVPCVTRLHTPLELILRRGEQPAIYPDDAARCRLERMQTEASDLVTSPSRWLAGAVGEMWHLARQPEVIPNPIDPPAGHPSAPSPPAAAAVPAPRLAYVGRLEHRKGVLVLARALRAWWERGGRFTVTFAGGDTRWRGRAMSGRIAEELGPAAVPGVARLTGALGGRRLVALLAGVDAVVLPSLYENFPYSCLEAMAAGRAVVATRGSGFDEIVVDGTTGVLVAPGDPRELAAALERLAGEPDRLRQLGRRAAAAVARFRAQDVVPLLLQRYAALTRPGRPGRSGPGGRGSGGRGSGPDGGPEPGHR